MAELAYFGHVSPSEFEDMLHADAVALNKALGRVHKVELETRVGLARVGGQI